MEQSPMLRESSLQCTSAPVMLSPASFPRSLDTSRSAAARVSRSAAATSAAKRDAELVRRFNRGDESVFVEIVMHYRAKLYSFALSTLRNHADAEEVVQDTFIRAHRALAQFRGESSLSSWLHGITFNLSCNRYWYHFRRHRRETRSFDCALDDKSGPTYADVVACDTPDPAREAAMHDFSAHVAACMEKLSADQREILILRTLMEHSYEEIAEILALNIGTVKSRIGRARRTLREHLVRTYADVEDDASSPSQWFESTHQSGPSRFVRWTDTTS